MGKRRSRGEGTLYFWEDKNLWVAEITLGGKTYKKYAKTQKEARLWLLAQRQAAESGTLVDDKHVTLGAFLDQWFEDVAKPALRPSTLIAHESIIRNHIEPTLGSIRLSDLTPIQVQNLCSQKLRAGLSNRTVKYIRTILHQALDQAMKWGMVARNVADPVKTPAPDKRPVVPLNKEQVWELLDHLKNDRLFPLYVVFLGCGLRRGEALALTLPDLDLDRGVIFVRSTIQNIHGQGLVVGEPKSEASRRSVAMPDFVRQALKAHLDNRLVESEYVFCTSRGTPFSPRNVVRHFKKTLSAVGLPSSIRIHDLRHFFVSWLLSQGTPPKDVQAIVGHAQFTTTMDVYGHLMPGADYEAARKMDTLFKP